MMYLIAVLFRTLIFVAFYTNNVLGSDSLYYYSLGKEYYKYGLGNAFSVVEPSAGITVVGPVQPLICGFINLIFGDTWLPIFILNILISSLIPGLVFYLGILINEKNAGLLAGLWSIFFKFFVSGIPSSGKDLNMTLLFLLIVILLVKILKYEKKQIIWLVFTYAVAIHLDERFLILFPVLFAFLFINKNKLSLLNWKNPSIFLFMVLLLSTPWIIRNYYVHNKIVILTPRLSAFVDPILGQKKTIGDVREEDKIYFLSKTQIDAVISGAKTNYEYYYWGRPKETMPIPTGAIDKIKRGELPYRFTNLQKWLNSFIDYFWPIYFKDKWGGNGYIYFPKQRLFTIITTIIQYAVLLPFLIFGCSYLIKKDLVIFNLFASLIIIYAGINILLLPVIDFRYRFPLDPIVILLAFIGISKICKLTYFSN